MASSRQLLWLVDLPLDVYVSISSLVAAICIMHMCRRGWGWSGWAGTRRSCWWRSPPIQARTIGFPSFQQQKIASISKYCKIVHSKSMPNFVLSPEISFCKNKELWWSAVRAYVRYHTNQHRTGTDDDSWLFYPVADCPPHGWSSMDEPPYELSTVMFIHQNGSTTTFWMV